MLKTLLVSTSLSLALLALPIGSTGAFAGSAPGFAAHGLDFEIELGGGDDEDDGPGIEVDFGGDDDEGDDEDDDEDE
jgi:hypothetical protein